MRDSWNKLTNAFTLVFEGDIRKFAMNPLTTETPWGTPYAVALGDALDDSEEPLQKRPVAWRVKDYADGWIIYQDEKAAYDEAERTGALMQGLYNRADQ